MIDTYHEVYRFAKVENEATLDLMGWKLNLQNLCMLVTEGLASLRSDDDGEIKREVF